MTTPSNGLAVLIGRFQPFHNGHLELLRRALAIAPRAVVVLGSSHRARNPKDPFTWQERAQMLADALDAADRERVTCVPVRDYYDDTRWTAAVVEAVSAHAPEADPVTLVGHAKDASSDYLRRFPHWRMEACERASAADATEVRRILFETDDENAAQAQLRNLVPAPVLPSLLAWRRAPWFADLVQEHRALLKYKAAWSAAPYAPTFVTVDAIVQAAGCVLLVQRGGFPGRGLWAMPGGFLDGRERLLDASLRELHEETGLQVAPERLVDVHVFDHPERSLRGRTITHVHRFDLGAGAPSRVTGSDDAMDAAWIPVGELAAMEERFHEDHFHILDAVLGLSPGP
jgi:bifunctional NMN adenylyltransferase/nudix hydrolase